MHGAAHVFHATHDVLLLPCFRMPRRDVGVYADICAMPRRYAAAWRAAVSPCPPPAPEIDEFRYAVAEC